jgi:hypothetical protein
MGDIVAVNIFLAKFDLRIEQGLLAIRAREESFPMRLRE